MTIQELNRASKGKFIQFENVHTNYSMNDTLMVQDGVMTSTEYSYKISPEEMTIERGIKKLGVDISKLDLTEAIIADA